MEAEAGRQGQAPLRRPYLAGLLEPWPNCPASPRGPLSLSFQPPPSSPLLPLLLRLPLPSTGRRRRQEARPFLSSLFLCPPLPGPALNGGGDKGRSKARSLAEPDAGASLPPTTLPLQVSWAMENSPTAASSEKCDDAKLQADRVVPEEEWLQKWEIKNIGFHNEEGHPSFKKYLDLLLNDRNGQKIFFPLCGKTIEMKWLSDLGHHVIGVEISESALKEFFAEQNLSFTEETVAEIPGAKLFKSTTGNISLYCCSIYDLTSTITGKFDGIWDRGSLVAVNPSERERYAQLILSLMNEKCCCLLVTCEYDPRKHKGPPFYVPDSEVKSLYGKYCDIRFLEKIDSLSNRPKKWGLDYFFEVLHVLTLK